MGVRGIERGLLAISLALLAACGSSARDDAQEPPAAGGSASAAGSGGASGIASAGTAGGSGDATAGTNGTAQSLVGFRMDTFPWFVREYGSSVSTTVMAQAGIVHVPLSSGPVRATVSTHHHYAVVPLSKGLRFTARGNREIALRVSVKSTLTSADYFADRDAGDEWPTAPTLLTTEWATFDVPFTDLQPPEVAVPTGMPAFQVAFIVDEPSGPVEVWLDEVYFY